MNGKCATCKWWGAGGLPGVCEAADQTNLDTDRGAQRFEVFATAADDTDLVARLYTGPEFGCVHHESKEEGE